MAVRWSRSIMALAAGVALGACAPGARAPQPETPQQRPVWPPDSAEPRIKYVRSVSRPEDLGIQKGLLQRIQELIAGPSTTRMVRPMAVVTGADGALYVADPGVNGVHCFDTNNERYVLVRRSKNEPLPSPVGLAAHPGGEVYVSDSFLGQVFVIAPGCGAASPLALGAKLGQPTGVAFDSANGRLYVVDTAEHRVKVFDDHGSLHATFGRRGTGDGEFNFPTMIWLSGEGRVLVTDSLNFRVQMFGDDGRFLSKFGRAGDGTGDLSRPKGIATDRFGHVYVVDAMFHAMQVFDHTGDFLLNVGRRGRAPGEFWLPAGIFINGETIYVADSYNGRVQVFRYVGGPS